VHALVSDVVRVRVVLMRGEVGTNVTVLQLTIAALQHFGRHPEEVLKRLIGARARALISTAARRRSAVLPVLDRTVTRSFTAIKWGLGDDPTIPQSQLKPHQNV
jgi:hypothetical protein